MKFLRCAALVLAAGCTFAAEAPKPPGKAAIASAHHLATDAGFEVLAMTVPESAGFRMMGRGAVSTGLGLSMVAVTTTGALIGATVRTGTATCCPSSRIGNGCECADITRALSGCDGTVG